MTLPVHTQTPSKILYLDEKKLRNSKKHQHQSVSSRIFK